MESTTFKEGPKKLGEHDALKHDRFRAMKTDNLFLELSIETAENKFLHLLRNETESLGIENHWKEACLIIASSEAHLAK